MSDDLAIQVSNVDKTYGRSSKKTHALKNFSMSIPKGKIYGLLGNLIFSITVHKAGSTLHK